MSYANFEIIRPLYAMSKKISAPTLKVGDRFMYKDHQFLYFKTNAKPVGNRYLCCNDSGHIIWLDGQEKVVKINGIGFDLRSYSRKFKDEYLRQQEAKKR